MSRQAWETDEWEGGDGDETQPVKSPVESPAIPPGPIDMEAALAALASRPRWSPSEGYGGCLLDKRDGKAAGQLFRERRARFQRVMPRLCKTCGETFASGTEGPAVTCAACKAALKKRCVRCGEVFPAGHTKEKRCVPCLEKAAAAGEKTAAELLTKKAAGGSGA
jgi:hypothetical protein